MATKADKERIEAKQRAVVARLKAIVSLHPELLIAAMDETRLDLVLIALSGARLFASDAEAI